MAKAGRKLHRRDPFYPPGKPLQLGRGVSEECANRVRQHRLRGKPESMTVLGLCETRWTQSGQVRLKTGETVLNSGSRLQSVLDKQKNKDVTILMGDFNAKMGTINRDFDEVMGQQGLDIVIENGEMFLNLCAFNIMVIEGSIFPRRRIHKAILGFARPQD